MDVAYVDVVYVDVAYVDGDTTLATESAGARFDKKELYKWRHIALFFVLADTLLSVFRP